MKPIDLNQVTQYVEENIGSFHQRRLEKLKALRLKQVLRRKNPYLFKAKNLTPEGLIRQLLEAYLYSQEETLFGDFLEDLARFVCTHTLNGRKSAAVGVDLEFEDDGILYLVSVKSGPSWGNSSQVRKMRDDFKRAKVAHRTNNPKSNVRAVNGCCYGRDNRPDKGDYFKYCGQQFWELITGNSNFYLDIIEPLGHQARQKNEEFLQAYEKVLASFVEEFMRDYCQGYMIDWQRLVKFNSARKSKSAK